MIVQRYARYFAFCPVWAWPWLWLQLAMIERFSRQTGRKVLVRVRRDGWVKVCFVSDLPQPEGTFRPMLPLTPRWQRWAALSDRPELALLEGSPAPAQASAHGPRARHANLATAIDARALASTVLKPP